MGRIVIKTAAQARRDARIDYARVDATTEEEIRQQAIEDGEDPDADYDDWHPSPIQVRQSFNMTQAKFAAMLNMPVATWRNWEQGRTSIDAPGRALLTILRREPEAVRRAMKPKQAAE